MDALTIIGAIITNTVVLGGVAAFWGWWKNRSTETRQHRQQREAGQEEYLQETQGDALKTALGLLERTVEHLIATNNGKFLTLDESLVKGLGKVDDTIRPALRTLTDIRAQSTVMVRDWSRWNEILSDLDQMYHRIDDTTRRIEAKLTEAEKE